MKLTKLHVLNIRTWPGKLLNLREVIPHSQIHHALVSSILSDALFYSGAKATPRLRIIAIGAFTVADASNPRAMGRDYELDTLIKPRIYLVEWHRGIHGQLNPILAPLTLQNIHLYSGDLRIFEPRWLK